MKRTPLCALCLLLAAACTSTTPPPPVEYLLQPTLPTGVTRLGENGQTVALGRVEIAPYLEREGIVVETADRRLAAAQGHRWAEPLQHSLRRLLQVEITRNSGLNVAPRVRAGTTTSVIVDVGIQRFHGTEAGLVTLVADWTVRVPRENRVIGHHQLVREMRTDADGYDALVRAHLSLAEGLAAAIARSLSEALEDGAAQP